MANLFDGGEVERDAGMERAAANAKRQAVLVEAKSRAQIAARMFGTVTIDDVMQTLDYQGWDISLLGNAAGSIFKGPEWEFTGEWRKSRRTSNHARPVRVWRLKRG